GGLSGPAALPETSSARLHVGVLPWSHRRANGKGRAGSLGAARPSQAVPGRAASVRNGQAAAMLGSADRLPANARRSVRLGTGRAPGGTARPASRQEEVGQFRQDRAVAPGRGAVTRPLSGLNFDGVNT